MVSFIKLDFTIWYCRSARNITTSGM